MSSASKARGSAWERQLLDYFRGLGMPTERLRQTGAKDEGDLAAQDSDLIYVVEAKNVARITLADFVDQALIERDHYVASRRLDRRRAMPVSIIKRRGKGVRDAYVVTTVREFFEEE